MDRILQDDLNNIKNADFIPWEELEDKTVLITGATGLIGYNLVRALLYCVKKLKIIAVTRDVRGAQKRFEDVADDRLSFCESEIEALKDLDDDIDYIIHGAANTSSRFFIEHPVECINTIIQGTENMLEIARLKQVKSFVFLSSMEVYGYPTEGDKVRETDPCYLNSTEVRNSYPIAKIAAEALCKSYFTENGIPVKILRLTQTFGPGVKYEDARVFAEFARCAIEKKSIVLKTEGKTKRNYLYTADAVTAILVILLKGINGEAYNVANEDTYCSIKQFAEIVAMNYHIDVRNEIQDISINGYAHDLYMNLDTTKLQSTGWKIHKTSLALNSMIIRLVDWMTENYNDHSID